MEQVVLIILLLAAAGMIITWLALSSSKVEEKADDVTCRTDIQLRSKVSFNPTSVLVNARPLLCKTSDHKLKGSRVELEEQMARLMSRCWWMFNEGRQDDVLNSNQIAEFFNWKGTNKCFICSTAIIDQSEIEDGPITAPQLYDYVTKTDHHKVKGETHLSYIQSYGGHGAVSILNALEPNNAYGIAFLAKNKDDKNGIDIWKPSLALAGVVTVGVTGAVCAGTAGIGCIVVAGLGWAGATSGVALTYKDVKKSFYDTDERAVSMIVLDDLQSLQDNGKCDFVKSLEER